MSIRIVTSAVVATAFVVIAVQAMALSRATNERDFYKMTSLKAQGLAAKSADESDRWHDVANQYMAEVFLLRANDRIAKMNPNAPARQIAEAVARYASFYRLDPIWLLAQVEQESHYNPRAVGLNKERGLMQITKTTAQELDLNWEQAFDVDRNIEAGARYMATHLRTYGDLRRAQLRYNGGNPEYPELIRARYLKISN